MNGYRILCIVLLGLISICSRAAGANVVVSDVDVQVRQPWSGVVDVYYTVTADIPGDEIVEMSFYGENVESGEQFELKSLEGDGVGASVGAGRHHVVWDVARDYPDLVCKSFSLTVTAGRRPQYIIVDLSEAHSAIQYPVEGLEELPEPLPENYKTTKLVMRRIDATTFPMGAGTDHQVTLTDCYYMGIYEMTQKQWALVMHENKAEFAGDDHPVESVYYYNIRGSLEGAGWPQHNRVDAQSLMGKLRAKTGLEFDLPTEAQWENACRAGTTRAYNDPDKNGGEGADKLVSDNSRDANLDVLGIYYAASNGQHAAVGSLKPNSYGLYDMHGNINEFCLDNYVYTLSNNAETNPVGSTSSSYGRVRRGGSWKNYASSCSSYSRSYVNNSSKYNDVGLRLCSAPFAEIVSSKSGETYLDTRFCSVFRLAQQNCTIAIPGPGNLWIDGELVAENLDRGTYPWDCSANPDGRYEIVFDGAERIASHIVVNKSVTLQSGLLTSSEVWGAGSVTVVTDDLTVPNGVALTVEPGAVVKFCKNTEIFVADGAALIADGAIFTNIDDDSAGGDSCFDGPESRFVFDEWLIDGPGDIQTDEHTEMRYRSKVVGGMISDQTVWQGYHLYHVTSPIIVERGSSLEIRAGAVVKFDAASGLTVQGLLAVEGTLDNPVCFTSVRDDSVGGDTNGDGESSNPAPGDWLSIIADGGRIEMAYADIAYGGADGEPGMLHVKADGFIRLYDGIIRQSSSYAVSNEDGSVDAKNIAFTKCSSVLHSVDLGTSLINCVIDDVQVVFGGTHGSFVNCVFTRVSDAFDQNSSAHFSYSVFWNPVGYGPQSFDGVVNTGNIWADPLFTDPDLGVYTVQDGSPVIDAGNGSVAPSLDYFGQARVDHPLVDNVGLPNLENDIPDIGIYEDVKYSKLPGVPGMLIPKDGHLLTSRVEALDWKDPLSNSTWFHIQLSGEHGSIIDEWTQDKPFILPISLKHGAYRWKLRSWNPSGMSSWSAESAFSMDKMLPGKMILSTANDQLNRFPVITWSLQEADSKWFNLLLVRDGSVVKDVWLKDVLSWSPTEGLAAGEYQCWVRGWNVDGMGAWSDVSAFQIVAATPDVPVPVAPSGLQNDNDVTYQWAHDGKAVWYQLWSGQDGLSQVSKWYKAEDILVELGEFEWPPAGATVAQVTFADHKWGAYKWYVRGWSPDGMGEWSEAGTFSLGAATAILGSCERLTWNDALTSDANWFHVIIDDVVNQETVRKFWVRRDATESVQGLCSFQLEAVLEDGQYGWTVRAWDDVHGMGPWSGVNRFNVDGFPGMVAIPAGDIFVPYHGIGGYAVGNYSLKSETFCIDQCEVTRGQWDHVAEWADQNDYVFVDNYESKGLDHPALVSWYDAVLWCNARSEMEGRTPCYINYSSGEVCRSGNYSPYWKQDANGYRLPSGDEWEYAARGQVVNYPFPWGYTVSHYKANYMSAYRFDFDVSPTIGYHPDYAVGERPYTSPVGSFAPISYGLYDVLGNASEWCYDKSSSLRLNRGGGYGSGARELALSMHHYINAGLGCGFRTVCRPVTAE